MIETRENLFLHYGFKLKKIHHHSFGVGLAFKNNSQLVCMTVKPLALPVIMNEIMRCVELEIFAQ